MKQANLTAEFEHSKTATGPKAPGSKALCPDVEALHLLNVLRGPLRGPGSHALQTSPCLWPKHPSSVLCSAEAAVSLQPGDVLMPAARPYTATVTQDFLMEVCGQCLLQIKRHSVPCRQCMQVAYCSDSCRLWHHRAGGRGEEGLGGGMLQMDEPDLCTCVCMCVRECIFGAINRGVCVCCTCFLRPSLWQRESGFGGEYLHPHPQSLTNNNCG